MMKTFSQIVADFLEERSALGFKDTGLKCRMNRIIRLQVKVDFGRPVLSQELLEEWAQMLPLESVGTRSNRVSDLRALSLYMQRMGHDAVTVPKRYVPYKDSSYQPYIFSEGELASILSCVDERCMGGVSLTADFVYPIVFRLLIGSGLRVSEALAIRKADYDPDAGVIRLVETKDHRERFIPIAGSTNERMKHCTRQLATRFEGYSFTEYLLPNAYGKPYSKITLYAFFREMLWQAGISHGGRGRGPRLHDLRHTYAVMVLNRGFCEGKEMGALLQGLSIYMGHTGLKSSERYLRMTKEMHSKVTGCYTETFGWVLEGGRCHEGE